ncbi:MAG: DUF4175 family protein [Rhodospirillales bacterium]|nr:DUF4175 family protein [Rhodospirillales bacterium]
MTAGPSRSYRRMLALAGASLLWERLWARLWPFVTIAGLFPALALLDLLPRLRAWLHLAVLVAFVAALVAALAHAVRGARWPERAECRRRLERDSALSHRPLSTLEDRLTGGSDDPLARSLWALHRQRQAAAAARLSLHAPSPGVARLEPWGLRAGVLLLLVIGLVAAGGAAGERVGRALVPAVAGAPQPRLAVEIWITPPAYTGAAPVLLGSGAASAAVATGSGVEEPVPVPFGSKLLAQVSGVRGQPRLLLGDEELEFAPLGGEGGGARGWRAETVVTGGARLEVASGWRTLAEWPVRVVPDEPPSVAFANPLEPAGNGATRLDFTAADDNGVRAVAAEIRRDLGPAEPDDANGSEEEILRVDLDLPAAANGAVSAAATEDLSEHAWAGTPVRIRLVARDAVDQVGVSDEARLVLPERTFRHPVAQAIIAERRRLDPASPAAPRKDVAARLSAIGQRPDAFGGDVVVSLALSIAGARLLNDQDGIASVRELLWAAALALDEGDVPRAEKALAEAREKLQQALASGAEEAEIERLADALEQALSAYIDAIAEELARRGGAVPAAMAADAMLGTDELRALMDMVREMARTGARDGANQLLEQLQAMLEGLRNGLDAAGDSAAMVEAGALMQALRELADRQQRLLDQTFARMREAENAPADLRPSRRPGGSEANADARAQTELRGELGAVNDRLRSFLGGVPGALQAADEAMGRAAGALRRNDLGAGGGAQGEALQALREAQQAAGQAMGQRLGGGLALFPGGGRGGDIFGRSPGGRRGLGVGEVEIPDERELRRASEILEELRRRAGERSRPEAELDYIERLLRRF